MTQLTYRQLQQALKQAKVDGLTQIALNTTKAALQAEYTRLFEKATEETKAATQENLKTSYEVVWDKKYVNGVVNLRTANHTLQAKFEIVEAGRTTKCNFFEVVSTDILVTYPDGGTERFDFNPARYYMLLGLQTAKEIEQDPLLNAIYRAATDGVADVTINPWGHLAGNYGSVAKRPFGQVSLFTRRNGSYDVVVKRMDTHLKVNVKNHPVQNYNWSVHRRAAALYFKALQYDWRR